jgi:hypothetical protein
MARHIFVPSAVFSFDFRRGICWQELGFEPKMHAQENVVTFFKMMPQAGDPVRADKTLRGTMPIRAYRFCDPFVAASGFGWYLSPPIDFALLYDGSTIFWKPLADSSWYPLELAQVPGFEDYFNNGVPSDYKGLAPPFLAALKETSIVQIWTGYLARTAQNWSLLVRGIANLPVRKEFECLEGIIETDWWFGPIFSNIRITKTNTPIVFRAADALFQVQPVKREAYSEETLGSMNVIAGLADLHEDDWRDYVRAVLPADSSRPQMGRYATEARRRRKAAPKDE